MVDATLNAIEPALAAAHLHDDEQARRAAEEDRRADEAWRSLHRQQAEREAMAEEAAAAAASGARQRPLRPPVTEAADTAAAAPAAAAAATAARADDEADAHGWTPREQRALEEALRSHPAAGFESAAARWRAVAGSPGLEARSARDCVNRCKHLATALRAVQPPPLLRLLGADVLLSVLEPLRGADLCRVACVCRELCALAHDDALWLPLADALPAKWRYSRRDRAGEAAWRYCLRMREGLYGAWRTVNEHKAGTSPYLREIGTVDHGEFRPHGRLEYKLKYGAVCELVQLRAQQEGNGINHRTYKAVAEQLVALSANPLSAIPPDLHMTVREIYKTCYPGYGAATGSGAYAPGLQAGGSSTKGGTSGSMLGKGVATMTRKVQDEEFRARLETHHEFMNLIKH